VVIKAVYITLTSNGRTLARRLPLPPLRRLVGKPSNRLVDTGSRAEYQSSAQLVWMICPAATSRYSDPPLSAYDNIAADAAAAAALSVQQLLVMLVSG